MSTPLPEIWREFQLGRLVETVGGGTPSRKRPEFFEGSIPWLTGFDLAPDTVSEIRDGRERITEEAVRASATNIVQPGTVLVTTRVTVGKAAIARVALCFSQDVTGLSARPGVLLSPEFLAWFIVAKRELLTMRNQGAIIVGLTRDALGTINFQLPPSSEQQRIVEILQEAETLRRLQAEAERKTAELIPAIFHEMFFSDSVARKKWETVQVGKIVPDGENRIRTGPFGSDLKHSEFVSEGIPVLGIENVVTNHFQWTKPRCITPEKYRGLGRYRVFARDVMVTIMGTVGRCCVAPDELPECISTKHLCVITPDAGKVNPYFLWATLLYDRDILAQAAAFGCGAIMEGWNARIIRGLRFCCPPVEMQNEFERRYRVVLQHEETWRSSTAKLTTLHDSLLARAFTGELTADWREQHASILRAEARDRDEGLRSAGVRLVQRKTIQEIDAILLPPGPEDPRYADLSSEHLTIVRALDQVAHRERKALLFNLDLLSDWLGNEFPRNELAQALATSPEMLRAPLDVLAARGLVQRYQRQRGKGDFATLYRLPWLEGEDGQRQQDDVRSEELARLAEPFADTTIGA